MLVSALLAAILMTRLVLFELFVTNVLQFEHQQKTAR